MKAVKLDGFSLKIIALVLMLAEHTARYIFEILPEGWPMYFIYIGRVVFPIFAYLAVESYFKTSNLSRYITRIYLWGFAMAVGNFLVSRLGQIIFQSEQIFGVPQNIFLSLAVGLHLIATVEWASKQKDYYKWLGYGFAGALFVLSLYTETSFYGTILLGLFFVLYQKKPMVYLAYIAYCSVWLISGLLYPDSWWYEEQQWLMVFALPLIGLYDGTRGRYSMKYLFYAFYPLHLWVLYMIRYALGLNLPY